MMLKIINILGSILLAPFLILIITFFGIFRSLVKIALHIQYRNKFMGLLEGSDCIWAVEKSSALSIINAVGVLEQNSPNNYTSSETLEKYRKLVRDRLLKPRYEKIFHARRKKYGYFFWEKSNQLYLEDRVKWLDVNHSRCAGSCGDINSDYLKNIISKLCNSPLPQNHQLSWEILIGSTCRRAYFHQFRRMKGEQYYNYGVVDIPIIFRIHHSLGDGTALLKLLMEAFADVKNVERVSYEKIYEGFPSSRSQSSFHEMNIPVSQKILAKIRKPTYDMEIAMIQKDILSASMPVTSIFILQFLLKPMHSHIKAFFQALDKINFTNIVRYSNKYVISHWKYIVQFITKICKITSEIMYKFWFIASTICTIPSYLIYQAVRSMDKSVLHGPKLSGEKVVACWMENYFKGDQEQKLLIKIRNIKDASRTKFGDVILTALSYALQKHYLRIGQHAPKSISVVVPTRMESFSEELKLQNKFSIGILALPIFDEGFVKKNSESVLFDRLQEISLRSEQLRRSPDYYINYWVITFFCALFPEMLLKPILQSHSTLVFSNLPGPQTINIIGQRLKNIAFWIPHRENTGIGYSLLSYGGNVQLALIADQILIGKKYQAMYILEDIVSVIDNMYDILTLSCFSKKLRR